MSFGFDDNEKDFPAQLSLASAMLAGIEASFFSFLMND